MKKQVISTELNNDTLRTVSSKSLHSGAVVAERNLVNIVTMGGIATRGLTLPHTHVNENASILDVLMFFERINNASNLSLVHNTRALRVRTSSSIAVSVLDDSVLTVVNAGGVDASQQTVSTEIYDHYSPIGAPDTIVASKTKLPGTRGRSVADILAFFEFALTGSDAAIKPSSKKKSVERISGKTLAANLRAYYSSGSDCKRECKSDIDDETLDLLSSVLHHYYMIYDAFVHTNAYIYAISRNVSEAEVRKLIKASSSGLGAQSSLLDVMGILPSTILSDVNAIVEGLESDSPIRLNHMNDIARYSSYVALLHTYGKA